MRGTTPKITFQIPLEKAMIAKAKISFRFRDQVLMIKNTAQCSIEDKRVSTRLTRKETLLLPDDGYVHVQLEVETPAGDALKTRVFCVYSGQLLDEGELT